MWILPRNYPLSSAFAADMVESKEDLTSLGSDIESSLMWRSKPTPLRTWLLRWKRVPWLPLLFTRILKPSRRTSFETALASSLAAIRVNRFQPPGACLEPKTPDTCGPLSENTFEQLDLLDVSLKTSKVTSRRDCPASSAIWKKMVTQQRGEYSQRMKLALLTRESESSYWPTPVANDDNKSPEAHMAMKARMKGGPRYKPTSLNVMVKGVERGLWPTPTAQDNIQVSGNPDHPKRGTTLGGAVRNYPAPSVQDADKATKKLRPNLQDNLTAIVFDQERKPGHLNPDWVEWLMGVPTGWTALGCWVTE